MQQNFLRYLGAATEHSAVFQKYDTNQNGFIDQGEMGYVLADLGFDGHHASTVRCFSVLSAPSYIGLTSVRRG